MDNNQIYTRQDLLDSIKAGINLGKTEVVEEIDLAISKAKDENEEYKAIARVLTKYRAKETNKENK